MAGGGWEQAGVLQNSEAQAIFLILPKPM